VFRRMAGPITVQDESQTTVIEDVDTITVPDGTLTEPAPQEAKLDFTSASSIVDEPLIGTINSVNTVFATSQNYLPGLEMVFFEGVRIREDCGDYFRSESGGIGTGFDTITFVDPPRARSGPKGNSVVSIRYVPE